MSTHYKSDKFSPNKNLSPSFLNRPVSEAKSIKRSNKEHLSEEFIAKWNASYSENEEYSEKLMNIISGSVSSCSSSSSVRTGNLSESFKSESYNSYSNRNDYIENNKFESTPKKKQETNHDKIKTPPQSKTSSKQATQSVPFGNLFSKLKSRFSVGFSSHASGLTAEIRSEEEQQENIQDKNHINSTLTKSISVEIKPVNTSQNISKKWSNLDLDKSTTDSVSTSSFSDEEFHEEISEQYSPIDTQSNFSKSSNYNALTNFESDSKFTLEKQEQLLITLLTRIQDLDSLQKTIPKLIRNGYLREGFTHVLKDHIQKLYYKNGSNEIEDLNRLNEILLKRSTSFFSSEEIHSENQIISLSKTIHTSRFRSDFCKPTLLGKGGFGSVYKVSHKIDGREYAIKRIRFCFRDPNQLKDAYENVIREVQALSSIENHSRIVRYHNAWFDPLLPEDMDLIMSEEDESQDSDIDTSSGDKNILNGYPLKAIQNYPSDNSFFNNDEIFEMDHDEEDPSPILEKEQNGIKFHDYEFDSSTSSSPNNPIVGIPESPYDFSFQTRFMEKVRTKTSEHESKLETSLVFRNQEQSSNIDTNQIKGFLSNTYRDGKFHMILCIQMQLCSQSTLEDWLWSPERTNQRKVDVEKILTYIYQIVDAVSHIHDMQIIHRDVKPSNVFITQDGCLKLGDFGLAKSTLDAVTSNRRGLSRRKISSNTQHVGTQIYAAPEQIAGDIYDEKVDIFSIGVILFEMFHPFTTGSERIHVLKDLRQGKLPMEFERDFRQESIIIKRCTSPNPIERPNAHELLKLLNEAFGDISSPTHIREMMKKKDDKIRELEEEIRSLREALKYKQDKEVPIIIEQDCNDSELTLSQAS